MNSLPSRRALSAFARIVSGQTGPYRCPDCARLGRSLRIEPNRRQVSGFRQLSVSSYIKSEKSNSDHGNHIDTFLDYQLSGFDGGKDSVEDTFNADTPASLRSRTSSDLTSKTKLLDEIQQVEAGLQMSALGIEELEDHLLDVDRTEEATEVPDHESQPWYLQDEGEISEDEFAEIENLLDSPDPETIAKHRRPERVVDTSKQQTPELLPWYLREQESDTSLLPNIDIQQTQLEKYPDLPYDSPPLLQPLVSRLFYDHHLQDIVLLDLRNRDPPPVWGSQTIMILATVRSERQFAGVAEATSKWLKVTAGVQPRIDGLPKRESIVIKRRRLRRKSLRKPGYLIAAPRPTTWVSMYTGYQGLVLQLFTQQGREEYDLEGLWGNSRVVDAGVLDMKPRKMRPGGFEEEERVETSAPARNQKKPMWQKLAEKEQQKYYKRKEARSSKRRWTKQEKEEAKQRRGQANSFLGQAEFSRPRSFDNSRKYGDRQQSRQLHTLNSSSRVTNQQTLFLRGCPKLQGKNMSTVNIPETELSPTIRWRRGNFPTIPQKQVAWWGMSHETLPRLSDTILPSSVCEQLLDALRGLPPFAPRDVGLDRIARSIVVQGDRRVAEKLRNLCASTDAGSLLLLAHFGNLSRFIKSSPPGWDVIAHSSTFGMDPYPEKGFLWAFDFFLRDMPVRPTSHHWRLAILYYLNLQMYDHKQYPLQRLCDILLLPVSQGISIPLSTFHVILNHIALSSPEHRNAEKEAENSQSFHENVDNRLAAMDVFLECMKLQFGHSYTNDEEVYLALYKACCQPFSTLTQSVKDIDLPLPWHYNDHRRMLIKHYFEKNLSISPELFMLELLQFAHMRKWRSFLKRWDLTPESGVGKDADMWSMFWCTLARGADQTYIRYALRRNYPEMLDEGPQLVFNKSMAIGLVKCLDVVDPNGVEFKEHRRVAERLLRY
jgi:ribosomal silencing factor RsfS